MTVEVARGKGDKNIERILRQHRREDDGAFDMGTQEGFLLGGAALDKQIPAFLGQREAGIVEGA